MKNKKEGYKISKDSSTSDHYFRSRQRQEVLSIVNNLKFYIGKDKVSNAFNEILTLTWVAANMPKQPKMALEAV